MKGKLIARKKNKNLILSIPSTVIKDYEVSLICLKPSINLLDLIEDNEYYTTSDLIKNNMIY